MTMHNTQSLYDELARQLVVLNEQEQEIRKQEQEAHDRWAEDFPSEVPFNIYRRQRRDGSPVLEAVLVAKAQVLSGMATLKAAQMATAVPGQRRRP